MSLNPFLLNICVGWFVTKIFHPNVSSAGEICVNTLKKDWKSTYGIGHILVTIKCLLIYPNPESALDEEAGKLLLENYDSYCERAKLITSVHATPRVRPPEFDTPSTSSEEKTTSLPTSSIPLPPQSITLPTPNSVSSKSASPTSPSQPLQSSPANTLPSLSLTPPVREKENAERVTSPSPLSTADSNVASAGTTKAIKRSAASSASGMEKRKKALKRL